MKVRLQPSDGAAQVCPGRAYRRCPGDISNTYTGELTRARKSLSSDRDSRGVVAPATLTQSGLKPSNQA
jgi:hypothetical protein